MSVRVEDGVIHLDGVCGVAEAEALVSALTRAPGSPVDVSALRSAHTAVIQALLALTPLVIGDPPDPFLAQHIVPQLKRPFPEAAGTCQERP